jgi:hypothetical protein
MPFGTAKVVGFPVEYDTVGNKVKAVIPTADTLVARLQQVFVLMHHTQAEHPILGDDKLR